MVKVPDIVKLFQPLLENIDEGVIICSSDGAILSMNPSVHQFFDLGSREGPVSLSNLNGHNLRTSLIRAGLEIDNGTRHHCEMAMEFDEEVVVNGESRWLRINSSLLDLPDKPRALRMIVMRDVTAEKRLYAIIADKDSCGVATEDPEMVRLIHRLSTVASSDASILLQGESGTGKTELARLAHRRSHRNNKPFVEISCGAIPASLIETELFGHVKGAFTGAVKNREGRFKTADGGTLFLDEIGELPKELQPKLLRVLQDGEYEPVGSDKTVKVDVRLICASNQDLRERVDEGYFRPDLFYRIAVVPLHVPPLRDRPGDIALLTKVIHKRLTMRSYPSDIVFGADAMRAFMNYSWPGNVRELANAVEHCIICAEGGVVTRESLPETIRYYCEARRSSAHPGNEESEQRQRTQIEQALGKANGNKTLAAQILGIDRTTLWRRIQKLGVSVK